MLISYGRAKDSESELREIIEAVGATDANRAVVGALLDAEFGLDGNSVNWRTKVTAFRLGAFR